MTGFSFLSTYPPTRCGLATFTEALATSMTLPGDPDARIVRVMDDIAQPATAVVGTRSTIVAELDAVGEADAAGIRSAARALSASRVAVVQHEYGIYGGADGSDVIRVLEQLTVPSIVVLHTVLDAPTEGQRRVLDRVGQLASAVVVMTETARSLLTAHYAVDPRKVSLIPHGVAAWTASATATPPARRTILTWGLIGPGKGIEHGIRAMAELGDSVPPVQYLVVGQTHPRVLANDGDVYRASLHALVAELGVADRVRIDSNYLDAAQLAARVRSADLVLLPYDSRNQVTSGVLVEAIAAGKPVVATAFPHAVELLTGGRGVVVPHENPHAIAEAVRAVLGRVASVEGTAAQLQPSNETSWPEVALRYRELASSLTAERVELSA